MAIRPEVWPFLLLSFVFAALVSSVFRSLRISYGRSLVAGVVVAVVLCGFMLNFFRDPTRIPPTDDGAIVAAADGQIVAIREMMLPEYFEGETIRISTFLSLFDVHVNRAPLEGRIIFLDYVPGKRYFTFREESSEHNQHSTILVESPHMRYLVKQIVGPVARRVVYWLEEDQVVEKGERIGMMKFGSRLDMYFPADLVEVVIEEGARVRAGETIVARVLPRTEDL